MVEGLQERRIPEASSVKRSIFLPCLRGRGAHSRLSPTRRHRYGQQTERNDLDLAFTRLPMLVGNCIVRPRRIALDVHGHCTEN